MTYAKAKRNYIQRIMELWKKHGGGQHGPNVETVTMPLAKFEGFMTAACLVPSPDDAAVVQSLKDILRANDDFRRTLPEGWEGDPLNDACESARAVLLNFAGVR